MAEAEAKASDAALAQIAAVAKMEAKALEVALAQDATLAAALAASEAARVAGDKCP